MVAFHQGADSLEDFARGQIAKGISPGGRKIEAPCQGADRLGHFTRGQKDWNTFTGGIWLGTFYQGADSLEHISRGQIFRGISPGGKKNGAPCEGQIAVVWFSLSEEEKYMWYF